MHKKGKSKNERSVQATASGLEKVRKYLDYQSQMSTRWPFTGRF
ncbi:unnamed protein product [Ixodes persulcatus]